MIAAGAGDVHVDGAARLPLAGSTAGEVLRRGRRRRIADAARELRIAARRARRSTTRRPRCSCRSSTAARALGVLAAFDRLDGDGALHARGRAAAARPSRRSAATAVATAQAVEAERLRRSLAAAEPSAAAGRASCTTRRCRRSAA